MPWWSSTGSSPPQSQNPPMDNNNVPPSSLELYLPWEWRVYILLQILQLSSAILNLTLITTCVQYDAIPPILTSLLSLALSISPRVNTIFQRLWIIKVCLCLVVFPVPHPLLPGLRGGRHVASYGALVVPLWAHRVQLLLGVSRRGSADAGGVAGREGEGEGGGGAARVRAMPQGTLAFF